MEQPETSPTSPLDAALRARGLTNNEIAVSLGVTRTAVYYWRIGRNPLAAEVAKELSGKFGIPLHELRPDLWDPPSTKCAA
jgi:transcriptional regulator with XRE-family HTH domain